MFTKILKIYTSYGAKSPAAILLYQMIQKFNAAEATTPKVIINVYALELTLDIKYTNHGNSRKIYISQAGYQPQKKHPSFAMT